MNRLRLLVALSLMLAAACKQPTVNEDEVRRADLASTTWESDETNFTDERLMVAKFFADGTVTIEAKQYGTWKINDNVFTLTSKDGTQVDVTPATEFSVDTTHVYFYYLGSLCHLKPLGS